MERVGGVGVGPQQKAPVSYKLSAHKLSVTVNFISIYQFTQIKATSPCSVVYDSCVLFWMLPWINLYDLYIF